MNVSPNPLRKLNKRLITPIAYFDKSENVPAKSPVDYS